MAKITFVLFFTTLSLMAQDKIIPVKFPKNNIPVPHSKTQFCLQAKIPLRSNLRITAKTNGLSFTNGDLIQFASNGVCWWYSKLHRRATFLTYFQPNAKKPNSHKAKILLRKIMKGNSVVQIPGFKNFLDFSREHRDEIVRMFISKAGLSSFEAIGLFFSTINLNTKKQSLNRQFTRINKLVNKEKRMPLVYFRHTPKFGGTTILHAWLVTDIQKKNGCFYFRYMDSNYHRSVSNYVYCKGNSNIQKMKHGWDGIELEYMPGYIKLAASKESKKLKKVVRNFCKK